MTPRLACAHRIYHIPPSAPLDLFANFEELSEMLDQTPDNGGVYFVPAFTGLLAPYWREDATGLIVGMSFNTNKQHIVRAVLEAIAYRVQDVLVTVEGTEPLGYSTLNGTTAGLEIKSAVFTNCVVWLYGLYTVPPL